MNIIKKPSMNFLVHEIKDNKRRKKLNVSYCLLSSAAIFLLLVYGGITFHILSRGELSHLHHSKIFSHSSLNTHPHLQHHNLGSIFLEGLPPLRSETLDEPDIDDESNEVDTNDESNRRQRNVKSKHRKDSSNHLGQTEQMKYLRRMPID
mmetsp:Transcript_3795/g.3943  ORF Transcript_3795/g.3943 Transcript_3795/m.3943 type:complete len:150 (+) Transcript_3795:279-728(+)